MKTLPYIDRNLVNIFRLLFASFPPTFQIRSTTGGSPQQTGINSHNFQFRMMDQWVSWLCDGRPGLSPPQRANRSTSRRQMGSWHSNAVEAALQQSTAVAVSFTAANSFAARPGVTTAFSKDGRPIHR
ncbi:hypothetical protein E4U21_004169 [Claviceps maximensis]|nr:hypothetical protein E4U21_004169 [Claviceps maximensis]